MFLKMEKKISNNEIDHGDLNTKKSDLSKKPKQKLIKEKETEKKNTTTIAEFDINGNISELEIPNKPNKNDLLSKLTDESNQPEVLILLKRDSKIDLILFNKIKKKTGLTISQIKELHYEAHNPPEVESRTTGRILSITQELNRLRSKYPIFDYLKYDNKIIEITDSEINLKFRSKADSNKWYSVIISKFNLKIISKCKDHKKDGDIYYTFTANKNLYCNYSVMEFLKKREGAIIKKTTGMEVIKHIFGERGKNVPSKKAKQTFGFKNGWWVSFEDK